MHWYDQTIKEELYEVQFTHIRKGTLYVVVTDPADAHEAAYQRLEEMDAEMLETAFGEGDWELSAPVKIPEVDAREQLKLFGRNP